MKYIPSDMEFPLMLPDLDGDNVLDFAFTCRVVSRSSSNFTDKPAHNKIALASGQTGKLFGEYYHDAACHTVYRLNLDNKFFLTYRCVDAGGIGKWFPNYIINLPVNYLNYMQISTTVYFCYRNCERN